MNQMERAVDEDKAGQKVLRAVAVAEHYRRMKAVLSSPKFVGRFPPRVDFVTQQGLSDMFIREVSRSCSTEDAHDFDSTGQCRRCGAHRRPV